jgi:outer membrane protein assembly factor BamB
MVMRCIPARILAAVLLAGAGCALSAGDDKPQTDRSKVEQQAATAWPLFRGNAQQTGVAASMLPDKLEVLWKFQAKDAVDSTPAIADGIVYVGAEDEFLYALHLSTGKEKWRYKAGPIKAPVAVRGGAVYTGNLDGVFHCVDAATGKKLWTFEASAEISSGSSFAGDRVLFGCADETLFCLSGKGKKLWTFRVPGGPVMATPALIQNRTFVAGCDSTLHVIDADAGKEVSAVELGSQVGATAAVRGDHLYVGTMGNQVLAVDWKQGKIEWTFEPKKNAQAFFSSPAVTDRLIVVGSRDRRVHALDRKTGQEVWSFVTRNRVDSSPVVVGGRVYAGSMDGNLYVLDLAKGTELAKHELDGAIIGSPAVAGGCLVIGTDKGTIYCLGAKN